MDRRQIISRIPLLGLAALPIPAIAATMSAQDRVAHHFAALAEAMNELTPDTHGWAISAGEINTGGRVIGRPDTRWLIASAYYLAIDPDPRMRQPFYVDDRADLPALRTSTPSQRPVTAAIGIYLPGRRQA